MYLNILVPMALDHGVSPQTLALARHLLFDGGKITALHVHEAPNSSVAAYLDSDTIQSGYEQAREILRAKTEDFPDVTPVLVKGHTTRSNVEYATKISADCIVIGSHKPGLGDLLLGATAARVVRHSACSVHVLR